MWSLEKRSNQPKYKFINSVTTVTWRRLVWPAEILLWKNNTPCSDQLCSSLWTSRTIKAHVPFYMILGWFARVMIGPGFFKIAHHSWHATSIKLVSWHVFTMIDIFKRVFRLRKNEFIWYSFAKRREEKCITDNFVLVLLKFHLGCCLNKIYIYK